MPEPSTRPPPNAEVDNRRNYYRVLHVQPEAPTAVIKASYRTLMTGMRAHPDLGGSHAEAAMLNEAWNVLSDPERRAAYDRLLRRRGYPAPRGPGAAGAFSPLRPGRSGGAGMAGAGAPAGASAGASAPPPPRAQAQAQAQADRPSQPDAHAQSDAHGSTPPNTPPNTPPPAGGSADAPGARAGAAPATEANASAAEVAVEPVVLAREHRCPLCGQAHAPDPRPDAQCLRCHAPLAALPQPGSPGHELLGRRGAMRREQQHVAMLRIGWPSPELPVRWRDLSLTGLSFFAPQPVAVGQHVHVADQALDAVAEVVGCRPQGRLFTVHARLLTARLLQPTGVFVSAQA